MTPTDRLTSRQAAVYLGLKPGTLEVWRCLRRPYQPMYLRLGRKIVYLKADLDAYLAGRRSGP